jgi:glutathione S-transferase
MNPLTVWGVGTTRTMRVQWLMFELGLDYETQRIESRTGETQNPSYLKLNPKQKIPSLLDGDFVVTESTAIMRHLRRCYDTLGYDQYQQTLEGQAVYDEWLSFMLMELDATSLYVVRRHRDLHAIYGEADNAVSSSIAYFEKMISAVEDQIEGRQFVWGSCFSELDIHLTILLDWAMAVDAKVPEAFVNYYETMTHRDAYVAARKFNYSGLQLPTVRL